MHTLVIKLKKPFLCIYFGICVERGIGMFFVVAKNLLRYINRNIKDIKIFSIIDKYNNTYYKYYR